MAVIKSTGDRHNEVPANAKDFAVLRDDVKDVFLQFVESSNDVFWIAELNPWRQVYVNRAVERVWGIPRDRFYTNGTYVWSELIHPEDKQVVVDSHDRWINGQPGSEFDMTFRIVLPNSQLRWVRDRGIWVSPETDGKPLVAGIATDVTESRLLEQALQEREKQLRQLFEDRERISQDLHDDILQSLYAVGLELEMLKRLSRNTPEEALPNLKDTSARLNRVITEIRNFLNGINAGMLPGTSFTKALDDLAASLGNSGSGSVTINIDEVSCAKLNTEQQIDVLNIIREAVSNSMRHAKANTIQVTARMEDSCLAIAVKDDGKGFDKGSSDINGLGLQNMKARAGRAGATIKIRSDPTGTQILLYLPLT